MTTSTSSYFQEHSGSSEIDSRVALLQEISFFKQLDTSKLTEIVKHLLAKSFPPGKQVLTQDQPVDGVYFLQSGEVQVLVSNEQTGQEELITHGYKGECFGEMSTLRGELKASASILTTMDSQFLYIDRDDFLQLVNEFNLWPQFLNVLASRLEQTNHRMTEVMKHLKQGMVQVDTQGIITGKFSMGFVRLIGGEANVIHGKSFLELVFSNCGEANKKWKDNFSLAIMSNPEQAELILNLLPTECIFLHPESGERIFKISYDLCIYQKKVIGMDIGLEDVTRMRELATKSEELEKEKSIIKEIYTKPETFRTLLTLLEDIDLDLQRANTAISSQDLSKEETRIWFGHMHSLKGTSHFLQLDELGSAAHQMENVFTRFKEENPDYNDIRNFFIDGMSNLNKQISYINDILLGMSEQTRKRLTAELVMSKEETETLENALEKDSPAMDILLKAKKIPSHKLVEGWKDELKRICQNLSKKIIFRVMGESIPLPGNIYDTIKAPLVHLLRNCAEHGIETIEERKRSGKPSVGLITFNAELSDDQYSISIQDNGRGISKDQILHKAKQVSQKDGELKQIIEQLIKENRLLAILYLPGFSTSEKVTELSGRGVGLDVVQRSTVEANGSISMKTIPGKGTKFTLSFPRQP